MSTGLIDWKAYRALHQKKHRALQRRFLVQGRKVVVELLGSTVQCEAIFATEEGAAFIADAAKQARVPVHVLAPHQLEKLGTLETGNELVAIAVQPPMPDHAVAGAGELVLALDDVRDPRNMGGLLRIADWFGIARVLCSPDSIEIFNPKVVQSTMGSIFRVPVRYAPLAEELAKYAQAGATLYLASMDGRSVFETELRRPAVLVLGSESHGLSEAMRTLRAQVIAIPRVGHAESLNVAMAAAGLCTEFARPR